jgi:inosose dehydratase
MAELGDWGFMPTDPEALHQELAARDLQLFASWVTVYLHDPSRLAESEAAPFAPPDCWPRWVGQRP